MKDVVVQDSLGRKPRSAMALPRACEVTIRFRHQDAEKLKTHVRLAPGPCVVSENSFTLMLSMYKSITRSSSQLTVLCTAHLADTSTPCPSSAMTTSLRTIRKETFNPRDNGPPMKSTTNAAKTHTSTRSQMLRFRTLSLPIPTFKGCDLSYLEEMRRALGEELAQGGLGAAD